LRQTRAPHKSDANGNATAPAVNDKNCGK